MTTTNALRKFIANVLGLEISGNSPTEVLTKAAIQTADGNSAVGGGGGRNVNIIASPKGDFDWNEDIVGGEATTYIFASENDFITSHDVTPLTRLTVTLADELLDGKPDDTLVSRVFLYSCTDDALYASFYPIKDDFGIGEIYIGPTGNILTYDEYLDNGMVNN